jgi:arginyl-tRNA synthetase
MLQLKGNTALYIFYALTRIGSILRKANIDTNIDNQSHQWLHAPMAESERKLAVELVSYATAVREAYRLLQPHVLCDATYQIAASFHRFYDLEQILKPDDASVAQRRIVLCRATQRVLQDSLSLLGISPMVLK